MRRLNPLHIIDIYIIKKFIGTFFFTIMLIISISVVFDFSENLDEFISKEVPASSIIFDYYLNFIPYFANLFSSLFSFIAVIYCTSKMAYNTEIIAILSSGVSYRRLMRPYMIGALLIAIFSFTLGNFIIPPANKKMIEFRNTYIRTRGYETSSNIHRQLEPGVFIYMSSYNASNDVGYKFTIEKFEGQKLVSKLTSESIKWDRAEKRWIVRNYVIRNIDGYEETLTKGNKLDTTLNMKPEDYRVMRDIVATLSLPELREEIRDLKLRGVNTTNYELERSRRRSDSFSVFILTLIGVALASRKVKGGIGLHLGLGFLIAFSYIMFMQVSTVFAISGTVPPYLATWIPNFLFGILALYLYRRASR